MRNLLDKKPLCILLFIFSIQTMAVASAPAPSCGSALTQINSTGIDNTQADLFLNPPHDYYEFKKSDRPAGGSQDGLWFTDQRGEYYFGKNYNGNIERILAEHLTSQIYERLGVRLPRNILRIIDGKPYVLSQEVKPGESTNLFKSDITDGFIVDAFLANWDVIGEDYDNVILSGKGQLDLLETKANQAFRIDYGGALLWRAQGERKNQDDFTAQVKEIQTMRDSGLRSGEVFGRLSDAEVAGQIQKLALTYSSNRRVIFDFIKKSGLPLDVQRKIKRSLDSRLVWLLEKGLPSLDPATPLSKDKMIDRWTEEFSGTMPKDLWKFSVNQMRYDLRNAPAIKKRLTVGEAMAIDAYTGGDFQAVDSALWGNTEEWGWVPKDRQLRYVLLAYRAEFALLTSGLTKLPNYHGEVTRVVQLLPGEIARYRVGSVAKEKGFLSTTAGGSPPYPGNVTFVIQSKTGKDIHVFNDTGENEVLFLPETQFKVIKKVRDREYSGDEPGWIVTLQEI